MEYFVMLQSDGSLIAPVRQETDSVSSLLLADRSRLSPEE